MRRPARLGISNFGFWIILATTLGIAAGCSPATTSTEVKPPPTTPSPVASASPVMSPAGSPSTSPGATPGGARAEALTGRWPGTEGTFLNITKKGEKYSIEIANLDGAKTFEGTAKGDVIKFTRNGKTETVRAASGAETGMKGFEKETNCVVVTKGSEGFCKK